MKKTTLTQIKKSVEAKGGEYRKLKMYLNGHEAYEVNGRTMTKGEMIDRFMLGEL